MAVRASLKMLKPWLIWQHEKGRHPQLLHAVMEINNDRRPMAVTRIKEMLGDLNGKTIGLLGLSFKPNTDDMRDAPSIDIAQALLAHGAEVRAYDPVAMEVAAPDSQC
jgi:UDPglucose 6-dehydrogenase